MSNLLPQGGETESAGADIPGETRRLLGAYERGTASWIVVSNEVGLGVVPPSALGRAYADELGRANQIVAAAAEDVYFVVAGLPLNLKTLSQEEPGR